MAERIVSEHGGSLPISVLTPEDGDFARFVVDYYQLDSAEVLDGAICYADGAEAFEVAVLAFSDEAAAKKSTHALSSYKDSRAQVFDGYAPAQAALVRDGIVDGCGRYVALLICPSAQDARTLFRNCFLPEPGGNSAHAQQTVSGYDEKAVLAAWKSGDRSSLDSKNRRILDGAADAISRIVRDDMSDAEKERAVHDWMTDWATFDSSVFGRNAEIRKDSDTPFGFFVENAPCATATRPHSNCSWICWASNASPFSDCRAETECATRGLRCAWTANGTASMSHGTIRLAAAPLTSSST